SLWATLWASAWEDIIDFPRLKRHPGYGAVVQDQASDVVPTVDVSAGKRVIAVERLQRDAASNHGVHLAPGVVEPHPGAAPPPLAPVLLDLLPDVLGDPLVPDVLGPDPCVGGRVLGRGERFRCSLEKRSRVGMREFEAWRQRRFFRIEHLERVDPEQATQSPVATDTIGMSAFAGAEDPRGAIPDVRVARDGLLMGLLVTALHASESPCCRVFPE